ncbi:hypothetical protein KC19_5G104100 [Ceratodon purpureus]|uniref:Alpha-(1,6)-fucosyltransferase N- and catalytic domain-containing protein n=1 Tax=Ceratodon purpureus TaxID=3225 RepID=A0A8T0I2D7_CERPU|nr:hypothetical protein KC19_5G104100 [Ceratodon purpureus]
MQSIMDTSTSRKTKLTTTAIALLILGPLLLLTIQYNRVPEQRFAIFGTTNNGNTSYPTQNCEEEWFPARHWTRQSHHLPNVTHHGKQMYGTLEAQHVIWNHQHPSSCHDKKFLLYAALGRDHGIGSSVHVAGVALQAALNLNRILVLSPQPNFEWNNGEYCKGMDTIDECYFEPLSSCTIYDVLGGMEVSNERFPELNVDTYKENSERVLRSAVFEMGTGVVPFLWRQTPVMFHGLLKSGGVKESFYYWWRAQGAAYLVRPTLRTLRELDRRRKAVFGGRRIEPGTVSVHVRHGDKWKENALADDATFLRSAEAMVKRDPEGLKHRIFLSTEDPKTVRWFSNLSDWTVEYTNVSRDAYKDRTVGPEDFAAQIGWDEEFLNSLLSLQLALECDGFVGAITSNWNRLIDELRSTVRCKHDHLYVDVVQGFDVTDYNW